MAGKGDKDQDRAEEAPPKKNRKATWKPPKEESNAMAKMGDFILKTHGPETSDWPAALVLPALPAARWPVAPASKRNLKGTT